MEVYLLLKIKVVINIYINIFIGKISKIQDNYRYFKTGSLPEWYKFETTKHDNYNDLKNNIRIKIIDTHCDETEIEIEKTEQVKDIIKLYCETKGIEYSENLYLSKLDLNKLDENLTIKELNLSNNQTLYIFEEDKIDFIINYDDNDFKIKGINNMTFHAVSSDELLKAIKSSEPVKEIRRNGIESVLQEYLDKLRNIRFANRWLVYLLVKFFRICGPDGTILIKDLNYIIGVLKKHNFSDYVSGEDLLGILMETTVGYPGKLSSDMNFSGNPDALGDLMKDIENHNLDEGNVQGYVGKSIIRAVDELLNDNMDSDGFIEMMPA